ncbi:MAG: DUF58 domain-containing protein [Bifidobacteriaceae bacterium]|nr:DUF58 domain-containing protein [Bifidobacteriaceae bacterium]
MSSAHPVTNDGDATSPAVETHRHSNDPIRTRITALGQRLSLPTVKRALGILEGEHPSGKRGSGYEFLDERFYEPFDEARSIDWKASARRGRPVVVDKEKTVTSKVWMLLDGGIEMTGITASGENKYQVAFNAMRMFAVLSMRRGDDVTILSANRDGVIRVPIGGGFVDFDRALRAVSKRIAHAPRDINGLMRLAKRIPDSKALIVIVSDQTGWSQMQLNAIRLMRRTHQVAAINIIPMNPFSTSQTPHGTYDAQTDRRVPAFLRVDKSEYEVTTHRAFVDTRIKTDLEHLGVTYLSCTSSEDMFNKFVAYLSSTMHHKDISSGVK